MDDSLTESDYIIIIITIARGSVAMTIRLWILKSDRWIE